MEFTEGLRKHILIFQQTEITEYYIYKRLATKINSPENVKILNQIAKDELRHCNGWKHYSGDHAQFNRNNSRVVARSGRT